MAAVTNGYRQLLLARQVDVDAVALRTLIPVSLRTSTAEGVPDNRVSAILYELPVGVADPVERLELVHAQLSELKASHMSDAGDALTSIANLVPPMVVGNATRLLMRLAHDHPQHSLNTVTTNVPGPQFPLYCLGREMLEYRPFVPIGHGLRIGTAILSYNGRLAFGITGDLDSAPDVGIVADGITAGIDELLDRSR